MVTSQIVKYVDFAKIQTSRYLKNKTLFFLEIKKSINYSSRTTLWQKKFCTGGNFLPDNCVMYVNNLFPVSHLLCSIEFRFWSFYGKEGWVISFQFVGYNEKCL